MSIEGAAVNQSETPILVPPVPEDNITDLLEQRAQATPDRALFAVPVGDGWRDISASAFRAEVVALAKGLVASGIEPGDRVAFMCKTSYEWTLVDFAIHYAGAVMVPIYETSSPLQVHWVLEDSGARAVLTETEDHAARFEEVRDDLPTVSLAWRLDRGALAELRESGAAIPDAEIDRRRGLAQGSDIATVIYTSGSTGRPKGCVLTHANFVDLSRNAAAALSDVVQQPGAATLLFVTLAHVFARFISVMSVHAGVRVGHQADTSQLLPALGTFQPTFLLAVPRVFEKVYNSAEQKTEAEGKGKIFRAAAKVAVAHSEALDAGKVPFALALKFRLFDKLVYGKLREKLGGKVRFAVSGSAPLSHYLGHFYRSLGVKILEGYGLTETTAPVTVNLPDHFKIGTVGPPLPGHTVRIADDGEIEVQGIDVFKEYWNNEEATRDAFTADGFFRTGDIGSLDEDGYLTITGRKKEIIVTAGGKNVAPAALEDPIRSNTIIGQVVVVGDQRPFISALVTLDPEMLAPWLNNNGEDPMMSLEEASVHPKVLAEVQSAVDQGNAFVSRAESIRKFVILPTEFIEANGHLTPKMSIRRDNILRDFAGEISAMYGEHPQTENVGVVS
ncbi:long-chain fatty acid--CoA ligase [Leucobacter chromiiresistens]|uniref:Acyl-CoA synthetase n=1 Tax=Leucobacter chromiiresistens TaxID=1079994 RepID=A0A147EQ54_9MICO|nr:long-chain fatty acid--CoA ligase [Leucobacter chromiiresistens]KTR86669.1 long-chain fatty acid--CoA ligase [Leucobacter chromiiresistens]